MFHVNCGYTIPTAPVRKEPAATKAAKKKLHNPAAQQVVKKPVAMQAPAKIASEVDKKEQRIICRVTLPEGFERPLEKAHKLPADDVYQISAYTGNEYQIFNQRLASKTALASEQQLMNQSMHRASSRIEKEAVLHRGIKVPAPEVPDEWTEDRWASSTMKLKTAISFSDGKCLMELRLHPGVRVIATCHVLGQKGSSFCELEQEITIAPGAHYKVIKREQTRLVVEVAPGQQAERKQEILYKNAQSQAA